MDVKFAFDYFNFSFFVMYIFKLNLLELIDCIGLVNLNRESNLLKRTKATINKSPETEDYQNAKFAVKWLSKVIGDDFKTDLYLAKLYFLEKLIVRHYSYEEYYDWHDLKGLLFFAVRLGGLQNLKEFEMTLKNPLFHSQLSKYLPLPTSA